jgi:hypothetical protein
VVQTCHDGFLPPFAVKAESLGHRSFKQKKSPHTLALLKNCITISGDFWDVRAFFLLLYSAFADNSREINNGILEATSIRGWFKLNRPFLFILTFQTD